MNYLPRNSHKGADGITKIYCFDKVPSFKQPANLEQGKEIDRF
jgi:hypothetical protein